MKIISIGTDRNLFLKDSHVRARSVEYGSLFDELYFVVFSLKKLGLKKEQIAPNVWIYPTNSSLKIFYIKNAVTIARQIYHERNFSPQNVVVTCQDPFETGLVGLKLKKILHTPLHIQIHTDLFNRFFLRDSLLNRIRVYIAKKVLLRADAVRVVSKKIAESLVKKQWFKKTPDVLPIFVDIEKIINAPVSTDLKKKYPQFNFVIFMASRLTKEKNIFLAFRALKSIIQKYPKVGLVVVGEGSQKNTLENFVNGNNLSKNVVFESWQNDLASYYKTADLFLLTSDYEGYGMTIIEAVASHCPVVSTDVGIASDILKDGDVFVCPVRDEKCLIEKIENYIENNSLRETSVHEFFARLPLVTSVSKTAYLNDYKKSIESAQKKI